MIIYYAHCIDTYNSDVENNDIAMLESIALVYNPNSAEDERRYREDGMRHFLRAVRGCDALAFRPAKNGRITAGMWKEIQEARKNGLPVFQIYEVGDCGHPMTVDETRKHLEDVGLR